MFSIPLFSDRTNAGIDLAHAILPLIEQLNASGVSAQPIVYALPRGGLPVAAPVAQLLGCPLDIVVAKKITRPENPELAIGAVTADGYVLWSELKHLGKNNQNQWQQALERAKNKAEAQLAQLQPNCPPVNPAGAIAILIDDGIATGMTVAVAAQSLRAKHPAQVWICAPVAPPELPEWLQQWCDRTIILETPNPFLSVSRFYVEFPQVEIAEAQACLAQYHHPD